MMKYFSLLIIFILIFPVALATSYTECIGDNNATCPPYSYPHGGILPEPYYHPLDPLDVIVGILCMGLVAVYFYSNVKSLREGRKMKTFDWNVLFIRFFQEIFGVISIVLGGFFLFLTGISILSNSKTFSWVSLFLILAGLISSSSSNKWIEQKINHKLPAIVRIILFLLMIFLAFTALLVSLIQ